MDEHMHELVLGDVWQHRLLREHFPDATKPVSLDAILTGLDEFGKWTMGSHPGSADGTVPVEYVCHLRPSVHMEGVGAHGSGFTPRLAALRCLLNMLKQVENLSERSMNEFRRFLSDAT